MKVASIAEAKAKLTDYVERCRRETAVFTTGAAGSRRAAHRNPTERQQLRQQFSARTPLDPLCAASLRKGGGEV